MSHVHRTTRDGLRLVILLALVATALALPMLPAEAVTRPDTLYHERPVGAGPVVPGFPIDHVGVVFDLPPGEDAHHDHGDDDHHAGTEGIAVRFRTDGVWGPWQPMTEDGAQAVGTWTGALVAGGDAEAYQVRGLPAFARNARAAALNTTDGPEVVIGHRPAGTAEAVTPCMSRYDWRADETIRTSDRVYADVQVMTVHHTATQNDDPDPAARVRAIYEYHVKTNGWDDIGYQALIDEAGVVYEGRWSGTDSVSCVEAGGTGWDFGHYGTEADAHMVTGAHTGGYNTGNFGIALLGTFTRQAPKAAARDALVAYLAELAGRHAIDPEAEVLYKNSVNELWVHTISGHQDFTSTKCPGRVLHDDLGQIRIDVAALLAGGGTSPTEPAPTGDSTATSEQTVSGTRSGSYLDTALDDGVSESLTEVESGGRPSLRYSLLEHVWTVPAPGSTTSLMLEIDVATTSSSDADEFVFAYSLDGGATYTTAITVPAGEVGARYSAALPVGLTGDVLIRVRDSDRTSGARTLDSVSVDHLVLRGA